MRSIPSMAATIADQIAEIAQRAVVHRAAIGIDVLPEQIDLPTPCAARRTTSAITSSKGRLISSPRV